ncbi:MAG: ABC transporter ATP-binding protein [Proteobacteria bacterium]|nr:ABC transporter ATP-binding protein [Pseudomonadota bacterium]
MSTTTLESADQAPSAAIAGAATRIELRKISKIFGTESDGEVTAVDDATFGVRQGEFVAIVGPSGCGKSTVLNMVAGLFDPTGGDILIDGVAVPDRRPYCAYMFQRDLLLPWRTIRDNVALGIEILGTPRREAREKATVLLNRFGLGGFADKRPPQLSGGMRQRAALMRTLLCPRDVLLLDEPFGALDALTRANMQEWLLEVWEQDNRTVLFITHDVEEALFLADRVLVMTARPGSIKLEVPIDIARPRSRKVTTSESFNKLKERVLDAIHDESIKAMDSEY